MKTMRLLTYFILLLLAFNSNYSLAKLAPEEEAFLNKVGANTTLTKSRLILNKDQLKLVQEPMGHKYKKRIFKYWILDDKTVWILNSIGKYKPITAAFVVESCKIKSAHVLVYREQHGYEIKYDAFLSQFSNISVNKKNMLNKKIDNISGATLSVNSMDRMARTALILDNITNENKC